jgi:hypothetical protein
MVIIGRWCQLTYQADSHPSERSISIAIRKNLASFSIPMTPSVPGSYPGRAGIHGATQPLWRFIAEITKLGLHSGPLI